MKYLSTILCVIMVVASAHGMQWQEQPIDPRGSHERAFWSAFTDDYKKKRGTYSFPPLSWAPLEDFINSYFYLSKNEPLPQDKLWYFLVLAHKFLQSASHDLN